jgi:hypothetical protein
VTPGTVQGILLALGFLFAAGRLLVRGFLAKEEAMPLAGHGGQIKRSIKGIFRDLLSTKSRRATTLFRKRFELPGLRSFLVRKQKDDSEECRMKQRES